MSIDCASKGGCWACWGRNVDATLLAFARLRCLQIRHVSIVSTAIGGDYKQETKIACCCVLVLGVGHRREPTGSARHAARKPGCRMAVLVLGTRLFTAVPLHSRHACLCALHLMRYDMSDQYQRDEMQGRSDDSPSLGGAYSACALVRLPIGALGHL